MVKKEVGLSRREEKLVGDFERILYESVKLKKDDSRKQIYHQVILAKYGVDDISTQRITPQPLWDLVLEDRICPVCNSLKDILNDNINGKLEDNEGQKVCTNCTFSIEESLYENAKKVNEAENKLESDEEEMEADLARQKLGKTQILQLREKGEERALRRISQQIKKEDENRKD